MIENHLIEAIRGQNRIRFSYDGQTREAEPHLLGRLPSGRVALHAYQVSGGSLSGGLLQWRNFEISRITNLVILKNAFQLRSDFNPDGSRYIDILCSVRG